MSNFSALKKFSLRLKEIKNIKEIIVDLELYPPLAKDKRDKLSALNRAALVLLCSHIEGYLEDLTDEFVNMLCNANIPTMNIPEKLKVEHIRKPLEEHHYREDLIKKLFREHYKLWLDNHLLKTGDIDAQRIITGFSNPGSKEVEWLLKCIGIAEIWEKINPTTLKNDLNSIVEIRNRIAHGDFNAEVTWDDVKRYYVSALKLMYKIKKLVICHFNNIRSLNE